MVNMPSTEVKSQNRKFSLKSIKKRNIIIFLAVAIVIVLIVFFFFRKESAISQFNINTTEATVTRQDLEESLSFTGTLSAADEYVVTTTATGKITESNVEKNQNITKDKILFVIKPDSDDYTLTKAKLNYDKAISNYEDTLDLFNEIKVISDINGIIVKWYVDVGDDFSSGEKIVDICNSDLMTLKLPFNSVDAQLINSGDIGIVILDGTFEQIECVVLSVDKVDTILTGNRKVRYVEVQIDNPGSITSEDIATAIINETGSTKSANFEYKDEYTIIATNSGTLQSKYKEAGLKVYEGESLGLIKSSKSQEDLLNGEITLADAKSTYENTFNQYSVKSDINGTVVAINYELNNRVEGSAGKPITLATVYDLSYLTFDISVDELDISKIVEGQKVRITCDALDGVEIEGIVSNVSIAATTQNSVTTYPVTVKIENPPEGLLPGMNVDADIIIKEVSDILVIPVAALQRGDVVYVKDAKASKSDNTNIPDGYKSVKVETGMTNNSYIEIVSGLSEGDVVYLTQTAKESLTEESMFNFGEGMGNQIPSGGMPNGGMPNGGGIRQ